MQNNATKNKQRNKHNKRIKFNKQSDNMDWCHPHPSSRTKPRQEIHQCQSQLRKQMNKLAKLASTKKQKKTSLTCCFVWMSVRNTQRAERNKCSSTELENLTKGPATQATSQPIKQLSCAASTNHQLITCQAIKQWNIQQTNQALITSTTPTGTRYPQIRNPFTEWDTYVSMWWSRRLCEECTCLSFRSNLVLAACTQHEETGKET